jgi:hypothetical protein
MHHCSRELYQTMTRQQYTAVPYIYLQAECVYSVLHHTPPLSDLFVPAKCVHFHEASCFQKKAYPVLAASVQFAFVNAKAAD